MAKKKVVDLYSVDIHPDAGMKVSLYVRNKETGAESKKDGTWNGTHWSLVDKKTGELSVIGPAFEIIGWHE